MLPPQVKPGGMTVEQIFELFPNLKERLNSARAPSFPAASSRCWRSGASCAPAPRLLLLDEPTEGLAPGHHPADRHAPSRG